MRAVFLASLAARRRARPTPAAILSGFLERVLAFMASSPVTAVPYPSCHKQSTSLLAVDRFPESSSSPWKTAGPRQPVEHRAHPDARGRPPAATPVAETGA